LETYLAMTTRKQGGIPAELERALDYARSVSAEAEVMIVDSGATPVGFEAEKLKEIETRESWGMGVRLIVNGRVGLSSTNDPNDTQGLIDRAVELAKYGPEAHFTLPGPDGYPQVETYDPAVEAVSLEQMVDAGRRILDAAKPRHPDVLFDAGLSTGRYSFSLANSKGLSFSYQKSSFGAWLSGTLVRGTDMLFVGERIRTCSPMWDIGRLLDDTTRQIEWARETAAAPSGRVPVLFHPRAVASVLLGPFFAGINGRTILQGSSPLQDRIGEQVFDARLSIWDDPTLPLKPPSRPFDDEGVPSRAQPLIENGVLRTFLYDLQTAGQAGTKPTGHGARGLGAMPGAATTYLRITPGDVTFDAMLQRMGDGVIIEQLIGMGQGNVLGGEASGNILLGYRVQDGRVVGRVKDTMLHCNIYEVLKQIAAIGAEAEEVGGGLSAPFILCDGVSISPKGAS
jgi:PmbA protein